MKAHRTDMSDLYTGSLESTGGNNGNITVRRAPRSDRSKMALTHSDSRADGAGRPTFGGESLLIDSILSRSEMEEVNRMLELGNDHVNEDYPFTSTQMSRAGFAGLTGSPPSLSMSPIKPHAGSNREAQRNNKATVIEGQEDLFNCLNKVGSVYSNSGWKESSSLDIQSSGIGAGAPRRGALDDTIKNCSGVQGSGEGEPTTQRGYSAGVPQDDTTRTLNDLVHDPETAVRDPVTAGSETGVQGEDGSKQTGNVGPGSVQGLETDKTTATEVPTKRTGEANPDDHPNDEHEGNEDGKSQTSGDGGKIATAEESEGEGDEEPTVAGMAEQFRLMNRILTKLDGKSDKIHETVEELKVSLEYSQHEIDQLKKENQQLKCQINELGTEEQRTAYQLKKVEEQVDRVDTNGKKRNLILEGVPEKDGGREDVSKAVWEVLDQLKLDRGMELDSCYRTGTYNKNRIRPIIVTFVRQADRDVVYSKRMDLRRTQGHKQVWVSEDLGPASKKARNMIRMIARQAQTEGIDHRTGKYAIYIDRHKYTESNLEELPTPLLPAAMKQIKIDKSTIAYQSERAPFSNFFPAQIKMGDRTFTCLEQVFQYLRAKTLNKPLAAAKIYLSRDPVEMKRIGDELGTSEEWEQKKFDVMYLCLKMKFDQHKDLRDLLLNSGDCELVEATPGRLWGCGATLSSNLLRKHDWPGENRQGKILMTVRDELRRATKEA